MSGRCTFLLLWFVLSCRSEAREAPVAHDWLVIPATRIGPVGARTTEQDLIDLLGATRVVRTELDVGEGFCAPGTMLYSGSPDALAVTWLDTTYSRPAVAEVSGSGGQWRTPAGVRVGSTLSELDSLAGGSVHFSGFGWDYGGTGVWSEQTAHGSGEIGIRLSPDSASYARARADPRYPEIVGEQTVTSEHPLIRELTIRVARIFIRWGEPTAVRPCTDL